MRARIAVLVDAVTEARETFAERNPLPDDRGDIAIHQRLHELRGQNPGAAMFGAFSTPRGRRSWHHKDSIR